MRDASGSATTNVAPGSAYPLAANDRASSSGREPRSRFGQYLAGLRDILGGYSPSSRARLAPSRRLQVPCVAARGGRCSDTGIRRCGLMLMKQHDLRGQLIGEGLAEGRRVYYRDVYVRSVGPHAGRRAAPISARQHLLHIAHILSQLGTAASLPRTRRRRRGIRDALPRDLVAARPRIRLARRSETPLKDRKRSRGSGGSRSLRRKINV